MTFTKEQIEKINASELAGATHVKVKGVWVNFGKYGKYVNAYVEDKAGTVYKVYFSKASVKSAEEVIKAQEDTEDKVQIYVDVEAKQFKSKDGEWVTYYVGNFTSEIECN